MTDLEEVIRTSTELMNKQNDRITSLEKEFNNWKKEEYIEKENAKELSELKASSASHTEEIKKLQLDKMFIRDTHDNLSYRNTVIKEVLRELTSVVHRVCHNIKRFGTLFQEGEWDEMWDNMKFEISKLEDKLGGEKMVIPEASGASNESLTGFNSLRNGTGKRLTDSKPPSMPEGFWERNHEEYLKAEREGKFEETPFKEKEPTSSARHMDEASIEIAWRHKKDLEDQIKEFLADLRFLRDAKRNREIEEKWEGKLKE